MYLYIVRCEGDSLYTGIAKDIEKRIKQHMGILKGGAKYTKSHPLKRIEMLLETDTAYVRKLEYAIKRLSHREKLQLIENPEMLTLFLPQFSECTFNIESPERYNEMFMLTAL